MFVIEDEAHAEPQRGEYPTFAEAMNELRRRADISWDQEPNVAPCMSWRTCGRRYEVVEYDTSRTPWEQLSRVLVLDISSSEILWHM